jgi:hypothetical protein
MPAISHQGSGKGFDNASPSHATPVWPHDRPFGPLEGLCQEGIMGGYRPLIRDAPCGRARMQEVRVHGLALLLRIPPPRRTQIMGASSRAEKEAERHTALHFSHFSHSEATGVEKPPIVGTIVGVCDGALDGVQARRIRSRQTGYPVQLFESKGAFVSQNEGRLS